MDETNNTPIDIDKLQKITNAITNRKNPSNFVDFAKFANENNFNRDQDAKLLMTRKNRKSKRAKSLFNEVQKNSVYLGVSASEMRQFHERMSRGGDNGDDSENVENIINEGGSNSNKGGNENIINNSNVERIKKDEINLQTFEDIIDSKLLSPVILTPLAPSSPIPIAPIDQNITTTSRETSPTTKQEIPTHQGTSPAHHIAQLSNSKSISPTPTSTQKERHPSVTKTNDINDKANDSGEEAYYFTNPTIWNKFKSIPSPPEPPSHVKISPSELPDERNMFETPISSPLKDKRTTSADTSRTSPPLTPTPVTPSPAQTSTPTSKGKNNTNLTGFLRSPHLVMANSKTSQPVKKTSSVSSSSLTPPSQKRCHSVEDTLLADEVFQDYSLPVRRASYYSQPIEMFNFEKSNTPAIRRSLPLMTTPPRAATLEMEEFDHSTSSVYLTPRNSPGPNSRRSSSFSSNTRPLRSSTKKQDNNNNPSRSSPELNSPMSSPFKQPLLFSSKSPIGSITEHEILDDYSQL